MPGTRGVELLGGTRGARTGFRSPDYVEHLTVVQSGHADHRQAGCNPVIVSEACGDLTRGLADSRQTCAQTSQII